MPSFFCHFTSSEFNLQALESYPNSLLQRPVILKFNDRFELQWKRSFGSHFKEHRDFHKAIIESHDNDGYLICGFKQKGGVNNNKHTGVIGKISLHGDSIWFKEVFDLYDENNNDLNDIVATSDGFYMACGMRNVKTENDSINSRVQTWLIKFDDDGNLVGTTSTSDNEPYGLDNIKIYPNPSTGLVYIQHDIDEKILYRTINMSGQVIDEKEHSEGHKVLILNTAHYTSGLYTIQALNQQGKILYRKKIIIK